mmetsp:Transcript_112973/g.269271  ORF Transcript_112973/g.269271 Transcript_112973/m.269271 type:complete len:248 (-) Transcript_112973:63-806(-)
MAGKKGGEAEEAERRPKKPRLEGEEEAKFVEPLEEVGDAHAEVSSKTFQRFGHLYTWALECEEETVPDDLDAAKALEEPHTRPPERGDVRERASPDLLVQRIRSAFEDKDWAVLTAAAGIPRSQDITAAVKQLSYQEVLDFLKALVERYDHPRERRNCAMWIHQVLDHESHGLAGSEQLRKVLRPLFTALLRDGQEHSGQVLSCLGKWRMILGLAKVVPEVEEPEDEEQDEQEEDKDEENEEEESDE